MFTFSSASFDFHKFEPSIGPDFELKTNLIAADKLDLHDLHKSYAETASSGANMQTEKSRHRRLRFGVQALWISCLVNTSQFKPQNDPKPRQLEKQRASKYENLRNLFSGIELHY